MLALAIGAAVILTHDHSARLGTTSRLALFTAAATIAGAIILAIEFADSFRGQYI